MNITIKLDVKVKNQLYAGTKSNYWVDKAAE